MKIFVFGSSLLSCYWNGAATYYRGIYKGLHALGHAITFAEPDIYGRQEHRDEEAECGYAAVRVYRDRTQLDALLADAAGTDLIIKHSGIGADDDYLAAAVLAAGAPGGARVAYWDVDAPATLAEIAGQERHPLRALLPRFDYVFTYGGGEAVVRRFVQLGARNCHPIYNGFDPETHHPVPAAAEFTCDLAFVGHRLPDREARVEEFFLRPAARLPEHRFLLAGAGWENRPLPANVRYAGHAPSRWHNAINSSSRLVLNVNRNSMAACGFSPPTRIFEAAAAGACVVTDAWEGVDAFFTPGREILVAEAGSGVLAYVREVGLETAAEIGRRMRQRALADHTYTRRAHAVDAILRADGSPGLQGTAA
ncbi:MAG: CgeB family protein [Terriglobales bacterium]